MVHYHYMRGVLLYVINMFIWNNDYNDDVDDDDDDDHDDHDHDDDHDDHDDHDDDDHDNDDDHDDDDDDDDDDYDDDNGDDNDVGADNNDDIGGDEGDDDIDGGGGGDHNDDDHNDPWLETCSLWRRSVCCLFGTWCANGKVFWAEGLHWNLQLLLLAMNKLSDSTFRAADRTGFWGQLISLWGLTSKFGTPSPLKMYPNMQLPILYY